MVLVVTKVGIWGFLLGSVLGSFVLAVADRSLTDKSFWGRSYCPNCKHKLRWCDLLPIVSYILLGGKCRYCKRGIGTLYLVIEVVMGLLIGYLFYQSFSNFKFLILNFQSIFNFKFLIFIFELLYKTFFIIVLAALFITDLKKMLIPDRIVLPAILISIIFITFITIIKISYLYYYLSQTLIGQKLLPPYSDYFQRHALMSAQPFFGGILMALIIGGFFWLLIIITKGKGMGGGDVKLGAFLGLGLGFPHALVAVVLSFLIGAVVSICLILLGKKHFGQTIPFGPFLVLGSLIVLFWGNRIIDWYLRLGT